MSNTAKLVLTLTVIGLISAFVLAFVFQWTTPRIDQHQAEQQEKAVFSVLPGATDYKKVEKDGLTFFEGYDDSGNRVGVALKITGGGFQGRITLMVGTDPEDSKIYAIEVLEHQETPGLGAFITGEKYKSNFADKPFGDYQVVKRPVDHDKEPYKVEAISGATISSTKVTNIVEQAIKDVQRVYGGGA